MTPVGHLFVGTSIAILAIPRDIKPQAKVVTCAAFAALANVPDFRIPGWGHDRYDISHSLFVALAIFSMIAVPVAFLKARGTLPVRWPILAAVPFAWLSHLLLDAFYNHGHGIAIFWPLSKARLSLPLPWFEVMDLSLPYFAPHNCTIFGIEAIAYGIVLLVAIVCRVLYERHIATKQL